MESNGTVESKFYREHVREYNLKHGKLDGSVFENLHSGKIVVLRAVPEVQTLVETFKSLAERMGPPDIAAAVKAQLKDGDSSTLEALSLFYRACRKILDSRYVSVILSDIIQNLGLPKPVLIDSGYCRNLVPELFPLALENVDMFDIMEFEHILHGRERHPNDRERILAGESWGQAHRDIDTAHGHFQANFWFPLHNMEAERSLLFYPEVYRKEVPQYTKELNPDDPDSWGYGRALKVHLNMGDVLVFHAQHLHASPSQSRKRSRFTCEIRIAAGALDDNSRMYRRLFLDPASFQSAPEKKMPAEERAAELIETSDATDAAAKFEHALKASTAYTTVFRLFTNAYTCLEAAFMNSAPEKLDDMLVLDTQQWDRLIARLNLLSKGDDLLFMLARIAARQKRTAHADKILSMILRQTDRYPWALQAGRLAEENGIDKTAEKLFRKAAELASTSEFKPGTYTGHLPPPRSPGHLQLFPDETKRLAEWFVKRLQTGISSEGPAFDPLLLYGTEPPLRYPKPALERAKVVIERSMGERLVGKLRPHVRAVRQRLFPGSKGL